jgi:hypothetical protein
MAIPKRLHLALRSSLEIHHEVLMHLKHQCMKEYPDAIESNRDALEWLNQQEIEDNGNSLLGNRES